MGKLWPWKKDNLHKNMNISKYYGDEIMAITLDNFGNCSECGINYPGFEGSWGMHGINQYGTPWHWGGLDSKEEVIEAYEWCWGRSWPNKKIEQKLNSWVSIPNV